MLSTEKPAKNSGFDLSVDCASAIEPQAMMRIAKNSNLRINDLLPLCSIFDEEKTFVKFSLPFL